MMMAGSAVAEEKGAETFPPGFVYLRDVDASIPQDMRYASRNNFTGRVLPGYMAAECVLRREVALALRKVQAVLVRQGYSLKVYDCYRPSRAVKAFGAWASDLSDLSTKNFYPRFAKTGLYGKGYISSRSDHSRGFAVDLTFIELTDREKPPYDPATVQRPCTGGVGERLVDNSVDMGTAFDCFDVWSHTDHPSITGAARVNRQLLKNTMSRFGFRNYRREWWHYSYVERSYPRTYYDFPIVPRSPTQPSPRAEEGSRP